MTRSRDLANLADGTEFTAADHTKLDGIETSADVTDTTNVVAALTAGDNITIAANGTIAGAAQYTHPNHSGEVTSTADGATVIVDDIVDEANLKVSNTPTNGYFLSAQSGNTGGMTWAEVAQPSASDTLNTIKTVDGTGSGLDADLLDGQHGAYYAPIGSPTLTGTPAAPTASAGANSTQISTTAYVDAAISALADSAPAALNTLNELAAALGDDANYAATTTTAIGTKLAKAGGQMTGNITMSGTETVDGRDLSVDGAKLDSIEASATADQTAAQLLTAIKTVDGSGSGLDADLLDGNQASAFATAAQGTLATNALPKAGGTASGDITFSGGSAAINISAGSDIRFTTGDWTGNHSGKIQYHSDHFYHQYANLFIFRNSGGTNVSTMDQSGNLTISGTVDGRNVSADGTKLDTIATSANNYSFPYAISASAGNSTVVQRHSAGYIFANYFNTTPNTVTSGVTQVCVETSNDGYIRHGTAAAIRSFIGFSTEASYLRSDADDTFSGGLVSSARDEGIFGVYDSYKTDHIWSMGTGYKNHSGGTNFGNLYGLAYKHTNNSTGGTMGGSHQVVWCHAGTPRGAIGYDGIWHAGNITAYSDIRVKENLEKIPNALDKVCQINGYTYDRTDETAEETLDIFDHNPTRRHVGLIAQELLPVLPEAVIGGPCNREGSEDDHFSVAYGNVVALLVEAIKELKAEVEELKNGSTIQRSYLP